MIRIHKKAEPSALTQYKKQSFASYEGLGQVKTHHLNADGSDESLHDVVIESLAREQGYLCAYCMCRIHTKKSSAEPPFATIEHIEPRSFTNEAKRIDYRNMLAVCDGNKHASDDAMKTCDACRGNKPLSLNPLKSETLSTIAYRSSGKIYSDDENVDRELNEVLNLNCQARDLIHRRKSALSALHKEIQKHGWSNNREAYRRLLERYNNEKSQKTEFVGIIIHWLEKHI